jgi:hypothetical protein
MTNLISFILSPLTKRYKRFKYGRITTFTYFIPAPPARKSGYREREFDSVIDKLTTLGFEILSLNQQAQGAGISVIVTVRALNKQAFALKPQDYPIQNTNELSVASQSPLKDTPELESIEGLYYID